MAHPPNSLASGYDDLSADEVGKKLDNLSDKQLEEVRAYEKRNKNRKTVIEQIDRKL